MSDVGTFKVVSPFEPTGDQPQAIEKLADGILPRRKKSGAAGCYGQWKDLYDGKGH